jgi:hypothetical protein
MGSRVKGAAGVASSGARSAKLTSWADDSATRRG